MEIANGGAGLARFDVALKAARSKRPRRTRAWSTLPSMGVRAVVAAAGVVGDSNRENLEHLWVTRVKNARLRLAFARHYVKAVQRDFPNASLDGHFEYHRALREESIALGEFNRVLWIYTDLVMHEKIPDEDGWRNARGRD